MEDLVTWLRAKIDADEAEGIAWDATLAGQLQQLRSAGKRFLVELFWSVRCTPLLRVLARGYADRPGYQEKWKP